MRFAETRSACRLDIWAARNCGFIAVFQISFSFLPVFFILTFGSTVARVGAFLLILLGFLLFAGCCRYPRPTFGVSGVAFWLCSLLYVPSWAGVLLSSGLIAGVPRLRELADFSPILFVFLMFPCTHFVLSVIGLYISLVPSPNNALQRTGIGGGASSDLDA
jgi:hypothetical protein